MNPSRRPVFVAVPALAAFLGLAACSDKPATVTPSDSPSSERVDALEREIQKMRDDQGVLKGTTLSSSEGLALASQIKDLKGQIADLQARNNALAATLPTGGSAFTGGDSTSVSSSTASFPPYGGVSIPTDPAQPIPADTVTAFRRVIDEVEKQKNAEQAAQRLKADLTRAGVTLSAEQELAVGKVQATYSEKLRELYRSGAGANDADRTTIVAQRDAIRAQFETEIRQVVPASEADKIIETVSRGGFRGGAGTRTPGGMGGMGG